MATHSHSQFIGDMQYTPCHVYYCHVVIYFCMMTCRVSYSNNWTMVFRKDRSRLGDRAHRLLDFLLALRHPPVAAALAPLGFDDAELLRGWRLLRALGGETLLPFAPPAPPDAGGALEAWASRWLP